MNSHPALGDVPGPVDPSDGGLASRIITILESIALSGEVVGVRSLARSTGIDKSALSRVLRQLEELQVVEADANRRYRAGPRLFSLAQALIKRDSLVLAARPLLEDLVRQWNETCYLGVVANGELVYEDVAECSRPVRYVVPLSQATPLHAGAGGRAILSAMSETELGAALGRKRLRRLTPKTIVDRAQLKSMMEVDRLRGYSVSIGERVLEGAAIAAPLREASGSPIGAIVMAFPNERLGEHAPDDLGQALKNAASKLSERLGYKEMSPS